MKNKKIQLSILAIMFSATLFGQVGINTTDPQVTLDVQGKPSDSKSLDGVLLPRVTASELKLKIYSTNHKGTLLYVTEAFSNAADATGQVEFVTTPGTYQFDGTKWQSYSLDEKDTLATVMQRGNYAPKPITFETTENPASLYYKSGNFYLSNKFNSNNVTGTDNNMIGIGTGEKLTSGSRNNLYGSNAGNYLITGSGNSFFGSNAGYSNNGDNNVAVGRAAGQGIVDGVNTTYSTAIGSFSGFKNEGDYLTAVGAYSAYNNGKTATRNTAVGIQSLYSNTTASYQTSLGSASLYELKEGLYNTSLGASSGGHFVKANYNVFVGSHINYKKGTSNITGDKNIYIGHSAAGGIVGNNNIFLGTGAGFAPGSGTMATINNRLIIHNNVKFTDAGGADGTPPAIDANGENNSIENGLIIGDFVDRWVKFNGKFQINPSYMPAANSDFSSVLLQNPTNGDVGVSTLSNLISNAGIVLVPTPPTTGNYILESNNGTMTWVAK